MLHFAFAGQDKDFRCSWMVNLGFSRHAQYVRYPRHQQYRSGEARLGGEKVKSIQCARFPSHLQARLGQAR